MNKKNKINLYLILLLVLSLFYIKMDFISAAYTESNIGTYSANLAKFPSSYKSKIEALHQIYPNAVFVPQDVFFDWDVKKEVAVDWNRMLSSEYYEVGGQLSYNNRSRSLIHNTYDVGYRSDASWAYNYYTDEYTKFDTGKWYAAAKGAVAYYMDPRNFLDSTYVFMFESHLYNEYQTIEGVEKILLGSFMANKICPGSVKKYSSVIIDAAKTNDVSAYMLASRLIQEQGKAGTSSLISGTYSGYTGYYNYFNVGASGNNDAEVIKNGLTYAKNQGWDSPYDSIVGGAAFIKTEYVGINDKYNVKGQLTGYLQKWDPYGWNLGGHQYMQNITAHYTEALTTYNSYASQNGYKNFNYIFYIPVYSNMPTSTSLPKKGSPNNYLKTLTVDGSSVSGFDSAKTDYTYTVAKGTDSVYVDFTKVNSNASVSGAGKIILDSDSKKISIVVTAQNGNKKTYNLTINRSSTGSLSVGAIINKAGIKSDGTYLSGISLNTTGNTIKSKLQSADSTATINVTNSSGSTKTTGKLVTGDKVTIKSGSENKTFYIVIYGDVSGDGQIKASDYVLIKNSIMGTKTLSGAYAKAADVNKDGKVKASDYVLIKNSIMYNQKISQ